MCKLEELMEISNTFGERGFYSFCAPAVLAGLTRVKLRRNLRTKAIYGTHLFLFNNSLPH